MRILILVMFLSFFLGMYVNAEECSTQESELATTGELLIKTDVPKYLEGATITVTLANGKSSTVPAEKFKVVPRKQQFITTHTNKTVVKTCAGEEAKRHRVSVLAGEGAKNGLHRENSPSVTKIESRAGFTAGLQYQYKSKLKLLKAPVSVGLQGQTNGGSVLLGLDF